MIFARRARVLVGAVFALCPGHLWCSTIFSEDFESGTLSSAVSIQTVGGFNSGPGVQSITTFGSTKAFGFGLSNCGANCFFDHVTSFVIDLGAPTHVSTLSFDEMELYGNWGSDGSVFFDGVPYGNGFRDFGRLPYNDLQADTSFRTHTFVVDKTISQITLRVADITNVSEIYIDNIMVSADATSTPEPRSWQLLISATVAGLPFCLRRPRKLAGGNTARGHKL